MKVWTRFKRNSSRRRHCKRRARKSIPTGLFEFLKNPSAIRYGLQVRMPTFGFSDSEATALVKYFSSLSDEPFPYKTIALQPATRADLRVGKQIFDALECISCHPEQGEAISAGQRQNRAPRPRLSQTPTESGLDYRMAQRAAILPTWHRHAASRGQRLAASIRLWKVSPAMTPKNRSDSSEITYSH